MPSSSQPITWNRRRFTLALALITATNFLTGCAHNSEKQKTAALHQAATKNDKRAVELLLADGASSTSPVLVNASYRRYFQSGVRESAIHGAAKARSLDALRVLLSQTAALPSTNGDATWMMGRFQYTPLDASVMEFEPPGAVTDLLIEAGYRPRTIESINRDNPFDLLSRAGTYWALASYQERHDDSGNAAKNYDAAAEMYADFSRRLFKLAKRQEFARSPMISLLANTVGASASLVAFRQGNYGLWYNIEYQRSRINNPSVQPNAAVSFPTNAAYPFVLPPGWSAGGKELPVVLKAGEPPPSISELAKAPANQQLSNFRDYALHTAILCRYCADRSRALSK
jgi:hypothetical protein